MTTSKQILNSRTLLQGRRLRERPRAILGSLCRKRGDYSGWILLLIILVVLGGER